MDIVKRFFNRIPFQGKARPTSSVEALQQKTLNFLILGIGIACLSLRIALLLMGDPSLGQPGREIMYPAMTIFLAGIIVLLVVERYIPYWVTSLIFILFLIGMIFISDTLPQVLFGETLIFFIVPIAIAGLLLRPWAGYVAAALICVVNVILLDYFQLGPAPVVHFMLFFLVAFIIQISTSRLQQAMKEEERKSRELRQSEQAVSLRNQRIQEISQKLLEVQEREKHLLAAELHDDLGQSLTSLKLLLELAGKKDPQSLAGGEMMEARELLSELMAKVRNLSLDLRPAMLDDFGLYPALRWLFDRFEATTGIMIHPHYDLECKDRYPVQVETAAFRIIQEALTNIARHAAVREAEVSISSGRDLTIEVMDKGKGFAASQNPATAMASSGVTGMQERASLLGGSVEIISAPGAGTRVTARIPCQVTYAKDH